MNAGVRGEAAENGQQFGLRRGTENGGDAVMLNQLVDYRDAGAHQRNRQRLRLIENHHAVGDVVEFAAAAGFGGVEGFKELYGGRDDDGCIPVFAGKALAEGIGRFGIRIGQIHLTVMLHHVLIAQNIPKDLRVLVDDAGVGDDVDDALHLMLHCMAERKGKRRNRFAAARGDGQAVQALRIFAATQAAPQHFVAQRAEVGLGLFQPFGNVRLQLFQQRGHGIADAARLFFLAERALRIQKISIHQTGEQHPDVHGSQAHIIPRKPRRCGLNACWQGNLTAPRGGIVAAGQLFVQPCAQCAIIEAGTGSQVGQTAVMPRNGKRRVHIAQICRRSRPGSAVIHLGGVFRVTLAALTVGAVLADVVQQGCSFGVKTRSKRSGEFRRTFRCAFQMLLEQLIAAVLAAVGDVFHTESLPI